MKIVACLAWYDEPTSFLKRCVESLEGVADTLVAYDGAWDLFPAGSHESPSVQAVALKDAATNAGFECVLYAPCRVWASQVEKRDALMRDAANRGDWLLVIDADEWIERADVVMLRRELTQTSLDVARVKMTRTTRPHSGAPGKIRRLYRAATGIHVERSHYGYRAEDGRWLFGDGGRIKLEPALDLSSHIALLHEHMNRGATRNRASITYRQMRVRTQAESWRKA